MWNPTYSLEINHLWDNIKTYDALGIASPQIENYVNNLFFKLNKTPLQFPLYPSTNSVEFKTLKEFKTPIYIGSNWDLERHKEFFLKATNLHIYGPKEKWSYLNDDTAKYTGEVSFDGTSVIERYKENGIGLAFHHKEHLKEEIPNMRVFEIISSGAVVISDKNKFIEDSFKDTVLYIDTSLGDLESIRQLNEKVQWIKDNPSKAIEMTKAAYEIFSKNFSLEVLLKNFIDKYKASIDISTESKENTKVNLKKEVVQSSSVEVLIRTNKFTPLLKRAIESLIDQTYKNLMISFIYFGDRLEEFEKDVSFYKSKIKLRVVLSKNDEPGTRSIQFFDGVKNSTEEYIAFLDDDDIFFSDHIESLVKILNKNPNSPLAYSGSVRIWENVSEEIEIELRKLAFFHDFFDFEKESFITSNSYLVRRSMIPQFIFTKPTPKLNTMEDFLFLKLMFENNSNFIFSHKVTSAFYWRYQGGRDNSIKNLDEWVISDNIIHNINRKSLTIINYVYDSKVNEINNITTEEVSIKNRSVKSVVKSLLVRVKRKLKSNKFIYKLKIILLG